MQLLFFIIIYFLFILPGTVWNEGYGGAGLTFKKYDHNKQVHFIYGIGSIMDSVNNSDVAFTNISRHLEWLDKVGVLENI